MDGRSNVSPVALVKTALVAVFVELTTDLLLTPRNLQCDLPVLHQTTTVTTTRCSYGKGRALAVFECFSLSEGTFADTAATLLSQRQAAFVSKDEANHFQGSEGG